MTVKKGRYCVGEVSVDAGLVWVGDPCYIKHHPELYDESKWGDFCANIEDLPSEKFSGVATFTNWVTVHTLSMSALTRTEVPQNLKSYSPECIQTKMKQKELNTNEVFTIL